MAEEAEPVVPFSGSETSGGGGDDGEANEVISAAVGIEGGCVAVTRDGRVFGLGAGEEGGWMPKVRIERADASGLGEWEEMDLRRFGVGWEGGKKVKKVVGASGGRGWFLITA